jgi:hypothetical protein
MSGKTQIMPFYTVPNASIAGGNYQIQCTNMNVYNSCASDLGSVDLGGAGYYINYHINNMSSWTCVAKSSESMGPNGNIIPNGGSSIGTSQDSITITFSFYDPNSPNQSWLYQASLMYSVSAPPKATFFYGISNPFPVLGMKINSPVGQGNLTVGGPNTSWLGSRAMSNNNSIYVTFTDITPGPTNTQINYTFTNSTPYDISYTLPGPVVKTILTGAPAVTETIVMTYDSNLSTVIPFSLSWPGSNPTANILSGGNISFCSTADPAVSLLVGSETSLFNYNDITIVTSNGTYNTSATTVNPLISLKEMQNKFNNSISNYNISLNFTAPVQAPLVNNFVFTNSTAYPITIVPGDCTSTSSNPIGPGGSGTWTETIQPNDFLNSPPIPHVLAWNAGSTNSYNGNCTTTLNTSNSGQGIVCTLGGTSTGITTALSFNNVPITPDQYQSLTVPQSSIVSSPNTYAIVLSSGSVTDCVYNLVIINNTTVNSTTLLTGIACNGTPLPNGQTIIPITVSNGTTLTTNLTWTFQQISPWPYGGPTQIGVQCNADGTGTITGISLGTFSTSYYPTMVAVAGTNPSFTQSSSSPGGNYSFPNNLPASGGTITLTFSDPSSTTFFQ